MKTLLINSIATLCCCFISQSAQAEAALPAATVTPNATAASESKPQPGTSPNANADTKTGTALVSNEPKLTNSSTGAGASRIPRIGSGDQLSVEIPDLAKKLEQNPTLIKNARLQLDCQFIDDLPADCVTDNKIVFTVTRDIIERVTPRTKVVPLCIRVDNKTISPIPNHIQLVLIAYDWRLALVIIILFMGAVLLCLYGQYTNLVRDGRPPDEAAAGTNQKTFNILRMLPGFQQAMPEPKELAAYSLAKVQMAWWSFFISAAFLFIWLAVGELNSITSSTVVLFGISLGTTVASRMVSSSKQATAQDLNAKEAALEPHVEQLKAQLTNLAGDPKAAADAPVLQQDLTAKTVQLNQAKADLSQLTISPDQAKTKGFLTDIMSDENGISIHRFQMVGWTVILTLVFVHGVWTNLTMPEFSDTLLTLMGISSGTYIALKIPEKNSVVANKDSTHG